MNIETYYKEKAKAKTDFKIFLAMLVFPVAAIITYLLK
jgi:hypothetical protein